MTRANTQRIERSSEWPEDHIEICEVTDDHAIVVLNRDHDRANDPPSALLALAELAANAIVAQKFAAVVGVTHPDISNATIELVSTDRDACVATAVLLESAEDIVARLETTRATRFEVRAALGDRDGVKIARVEITYYVARRRRTT